MNANPSFRWNGLLVMAWLHVAVLSFFVYLIQVASPAMLAMLEESEKSLPYLAVLILQECWVWFALLIPSLVLALKVSFNSASDAIFRQRTKKALLISVVIEFLFSWMFLYCLWRALADIGIYIRIVPHG